MPTVAQKRQFNLRCLLVQREQSNVRIKWSLLFLKAYALAAAEFPKLRQTYMSYPWPHLYQHESSVANLAMTREFYGEECVFFAPFYQPESQPLAELQTRLSQYKEGPIADVFKTQVKLAGYPLPVRRLIWWLRFHYSARKRIKRLGTFGLTTVAGQGATILNPRAPVTTVLSYGPLDAAGRCEVTITYDHRVLDGSEIARVLCRLEQILNGAIADELTMLSSPECSIHWLPAGEKQGKAEPKLATCPAP